MTHADEAKLIEQAKTDPAAFGVLYDRYVGRIYAYARRQTADDATAQDITAATFEKALRHLRRYRWQGGGLAPWLYRIARNEIAQQARQGRFTIAWGDDEPPTADHRPGANGNRPPEASLLAQERRHKLLAALRHLSDGDRDVLTLRLLEGLPAEDVAAVLGCSRDNVYVRLHRALSRLRQQLERTAETEANPS